MIPTNGVFIVEHNNALYRLAFAKPYPHQIERWIGSQWWDESDSFTDAEIELIYADAATDDIYVEKKSLNQN